MNRVPRFLLLPLVAGATVGCDQITKHAASTLLSAAPDRSFFADVVRLGYAENSGGFLSLGSDLPPVLRMAIFGVATGLALVAVLMLALRRSREGIPVFGLVLLLSGGLSNWIDRVARGRVVDFLNVGVGRLRTGVFNVADVAIMLGAAMVVFAEVWKRREGPSDRQ